MSVATRALFTGGVPDAGPRVNLIPSATISSTKNGSNPTFPANSIPESIVKVGSTYYCSYQGNWGSTWDIRLATASALDGTWTAYGSNPIITSAGSGWEDQIYAPEIMEQGGTYYMFYSSVDGAPHVGGIGVATASSPTGTWTKSGSNPILEPSGTSADWDSRRVGEPSVWYDDGLWVMAYMGETLTADPQESEKVGIATAPSATGPWTKHGLKLDFGAAGEWDDELIADPFIFKHHGLWWIVYTGNGDLAGSQTHRLGLAYADDPTGEWTRHPSNPVVGYGAASSFDERAVWRGCVVVEDERVYGVYGGQSSTYPTTAPRGGSYELTFSY